MTAQASAFDGRRLRRELNREAVIDALLAFFRAGNYNPTCSEIATRAGLSERSLFRYFDDVADLHRAAADREITDVLELVASAASAQDLTQVKIERMLRARAALWERAGPSARALGANAHRHAKLAVELDRYRAFLRGQLRELFAPELAARGTAVLPAIEVLCSHHSWDRLRHSQGLSAEAAVAALTAALTALLAGPPDA
jgi:TetR/AcrR family transcriptional regulator, regulator of autoinduction and epiphytic fitness